MQKNNKRHEYSRRVLIASVMMGGIFALPAWGTSYTLPSVPINPVDFSECKALNEQYNAVADQLRAQHDQYIEACDKDYGFASSGWMKCYQNGDKIWGELSLVRNQGQQAYNQCMDKVRQTQGQERAQQHAEVERRQLEQQQQQLQQQAASAYTGSMRSEQKKQVYGAYDKAAVAKEIYQKSNKGAEQILQTQDSQRKQLLATQIGNLLINQLSEAARDNARNLRNDHTDADVKFAHERVADLTKIVNDARGGNSIVGAIQQASLDEIKRQHNQILGDLENVKQNMDAISTGANSSGSGSSNDYHFAPTPDPATLSSASSANIPEENISQNYAQNESLSEPQDLDAESHETFNDVPSHKPEISPTKGDTQFVPNVSPPSREELLEPFQASTQHTDSSHALAKVDKANSRASGSCDYFSRPNDNSFWHEEGSLICDKSVMYRCSTGDWVKVGKCQLFDDWKSKTVKKLEKPL